MATPTIQAIETEYAGCRFRSRLEARWAVFFDHMQIRWRYEPEGLDLDGTRYLPDFHLPDLGRRGTYVEVKGRMDERSAEKILQLALHAPVLLACDIPRPGTGGPHFGLFVKERDSVAVAWHVSLLPKSIEPLTWTTMPFGWPSLPLAAGTETGVKWCLDWVRGMPGQEGWVETNYVINGAFSAARSARFEFGETG